MTPAAGKSIPTGLSHSKRPLREDNNGMTTWHVPTIEAIAGSDDLHISPFRADGATYGTPT